MEWVLTLFYWIAGFISISILVMFFVFATIAEARSDAAKKEQKIIVSIASILMIVLIGWGIFKIFTSLSSEGIEIVFYLVYAFLFTGFMGWLFSPSKKSDSVKSKVNEKVITSLKFDQN